MGESSFWYRPTRVVPDQRPLNGRCCCCCCVVVVLCTVQTSSSWTSRPITSTWRLLKHLAEPCRSSRWISCTLNLSQSWCGVWTADSSDPSAPVNSCIFVAVLYFPIFRLCPVFLFIIVLSCALFFIKRYLHQLVSVDCSWVWYAQKYVADVHNSAKCAFR